MEDIKQSNYIPKSSRFSIPRMLFTTPNTSNEQPEKSTYFQGHQQEASKVNLFKKPIKNLNAQNNSNDDDSQSISKISLHDTFDINDSKDITPPFSKVRSIHQKTPKSKHSVKDDSSRGIQVRSSHIQYNQVPSGMATFHVVQDSSSSTLEHNSSMLSKQSFLHFASSRKQQAIA